MSDLEIRILLKIYELEDIIESAGKHWAQTKDEKDLRFVCSRVVAKNKLQVYLKRI